MLYDQEKTRERQQDIDQDKEYVCASEAPPRASFEAILGRSSQQWLS